MCIDADAEDVQRCRAHEDCEPEQRCVENMCVEAVVDVRRCRDADDCEQGQQCVDGLCR